MIDEKATVGRRAFLGTIGCAGLAGLALLGGCSGGSGGSGSGSSGSSGASASASGQSSAQSASSGAGATLTIGTLATRYDVELPITDVVRGLVWEHLPLEGVADLLSSRSQKPEFY